MRIPISIKIIVITALIIVTSLAVVTLQSSQFLKNVMLQREEYSNFSEATLRANQLETLLDSSLDKAKSLSLLVLKESPDNLISYQIPKDKYLKAIEIYQVNDSEIKLYTRKVEKTFLDKNKFDENYLESLRTKTPYPLKSILQKNIEIQFTEINAALKIISIGFPVSKNAQNQVTAIAVAVFDNEMIQGLFNDNNERQFYLVDRKGNLLAHQKVEFLKNHLNWNQHPLVKKAISGEVPQKQLTFKDIKSNENYIGAYIKIPLWGIILLAQTSLKIVGEPAKEVQRKALFIAGVAISISLFAVFLFSLTITRPIEILAELIQEIPKGNFGISAQKRVTSKDEVGDLAKAFDHMTEGLKERDKVKNLFNKFHGSSITENLLNQELKVGGTKKDVTVFFSDIRGFTKFSEGHSPEEVVSMLNEYFAVMVKIINEHGGVVDKFIGDAIMAVWGVPKENSEDTLNAFKACLAMRSALVELNNSRSHRGLSEIHIGMGLHAGAAISGTIGSEERMEFTVIGDTVNVTSRIESSTKHFEVDFLVSDEVELRLVQRYPDIKSIADIQLAGDIEVKGKSQPLRLYKVI